MGKYKNANKLCPCGSGKKYKNCCMKENKYKGKLLEILADNSLVFDKKREDIIKKINQINHLKDKSDLNEEENVSINFTLGQYYMYAGYLNNALAIFDKIDLDKVDKLARIMILTYKAKILSDCPERFSEAVKKACQVYDYQKELAWDRGKVSTIKSGALIESGRIITMAINRYNEFNDEKMSYGLPEQIFNELIDNYKKNNYKDIDHYMGAKANIASIYMNNESEEIQRRGIKLLNETINLKIKYGYILGVSNDFSRLGMYYLKKRDYKQAIAYTKRDLAIVEEYGSLTEKIRTEMNLSKIYLELNQVSESRRVLKQAIEESKKVHDRGLTTVLHKFLNTVNEKAKKMAEEGIEFGKKSKCICGSGKSYEECCGIVDFDYKELNKVIGLNKLIPYTELTNKYAEKSFPAGMYESMHEGKTQFDLILRNLDENQLRLSWCEVIPHGGYMEFYELIDMSSIHLESAKSIIETNYKNDFMKETSIALSAMMLSVSALEAFINQVVYFISSLPTNELPEFVNTKIPNELLDEPEKYQKNTRFTDKINCIANILCNGEWSDKVGTFYKDLFKLISIRNELVHFKSVEYTRVIPPAREDSILKNLSNEVVLRDIFSSWPIRLLNITFAKWSVKTVEDTIKYIKDKYKENKDLLNN